MSLDKRADDANRKYGGITATTAAALRRERTLAFILRTARRDFSKERT